MRYYPVNLDLKGKNCLVVGGGSVGERKIFTLVECGAIVTVVSPKITDIVEKSFSQRLIILKQRKYKPTDIKGFFLVIGATNNKEINFKVSRDASKNNVLCNIVDSPELCSFVLPAIFNRGDFFLAVSTAGKSPAFAKKQKEKLKLQFGPEYGTLLDLMGAIRYRLLRENCGHKENKVVFNQLLESDLLALIKGGEIAKIDSVLHRILGKNYNYIELMK